MKQRYAFPLLFLLFIAAETAVILFASWWWFLPLALFIATLLWGSFSISSHLFVPTMCSHSGSGIILSFDDGPHEIYTGKILEILKKHNAKALFFVIGKEAEKHPDILRRITEEGHTIGIHTFSHSPFFGFFSAKKVHDEIVKTATIIREITGVEPSLFRPPSGITNPPLAKALRRLNLTTIGWTLRSFDTLFSNRERLLQRLIAHTEPGNIILLHDRLAITVEILDDYLQSLRDRGFLVESLARYGLDTQDAL
ncbi:polysaccharide deacetylase family protein [bacterium]|nr:polysaccharide deacetylase family protein [bacterium]